jgi:uncharacterized Zn-finger protein
MGSNSGTATLPVIPLFSGLDTLTLYGAQDALGLDSALYYDTTSLSYHLDSTTNDVSGALVDPPLFHLPSDATFDSDMATPAYNSACPTNPDTSSLSLEDLILLPFEESSHILAPTYDDSPDSSLHAPINTESCTTAPPQSAPETTDVEAPRIPCEVDGCSKTFRRPYLLRDHMRTHSGESSGKQSYLSYLLASLSELSWLPVVYRCSFEGCDKRFGSQSNLTRHSKTHLKRDKAVTGATQTGSEANRLNSPAREPSTNATQGNATPRRSRRLQNTISNHQGRYRILEPRTPASISARAQKGAA